MYEVILKRFENPDEVRSFEKGKFEIVRLGGMTIGRATYEPGWKWSVHVGQSAGQKSCSVEHVGMVIAGCATAAMDDGRIIEMRARRRFLHRAWPRQLGCRRGTLCLLAFHGSGRLRPE